MLEHRDGSCTGNWRLEGNGSQRRLVCTSCTVWYNGNLAELRLAAIDENYAGIYLKRLTAEGRKQLGEGG